MGCRHYARRYSLAQLIRRPIYHHDISVKYMCECIWIFISQPIKFQVSWEGWCAMFLQFITNRKTYFFTIWLFNWFMVSSCYVLTNREINIEGSEKLSLLVIFFGGNNTRGYSPGRQYFKYGNIGQNIYHCAGERRERKRIIEISRNAEED